MKKKKNKFIYPTLLQATQDTRKVHSRSWFDIKSHANYNSKSTKKHSKDDYICTQTFKIIIYPTDEQKQFINKWCDECIDVYNLTNKYIKENLLPNHSNFNKLVKFENLRDTPVIYNQVKDICSFNSLPKHTADLATKHCVTMYKSAESNLRAGNIKSYEISDLSKDRRRKNIAIEPEAVSKEINGIFVRTLGEMKSNVPLSNIRRASILQYDTLKKTYVIIAPFYRKGQIELKRYNKCAIDIGVRTFLTVYSPEKTYEIGTDTYGVIDKYLKKLDSINRNKNRLGKKKYTLTYEKYQNKLSGKIKDMHNKAARFLLGKYKTIVIGKVSIKNMVSNLRGNLQEKTKRRLLALSHYKFRMKLKELAKKFKGKIIEVSEYLTSKTCCTCGNIKEDLGRNKTYNCTNCGMTLDRDVNAAINIYKIKLPKKKE